MTNILFIALILSRWLRPLAEVYFSSNRTACFYLVLELIVETLNKTCELYKTNITNGKETVPATAAPAPPPPGARGRQPDTTRDLYNIIVIYIHTAR
ncbi:hypothetical protein EVAR_84284_1 [Eumeta japonica]|uniref:Secreted protein n=1 Tax=Eumeta variegata TaxID=151549 RepID=A0A4C1WUB0_EUMVA|nr:hypothetical protein EVAR_84284_1 [Eumeta japonica]